MYNAALEHNKEGYYNISQLQDFSSRHYKTKTKKMTTNSFQPNGKKSTLPDSELDKYVAFLVQKSLKAQGKKCFLFSILVLPIMKQISLGTRLPFFFQWCCLMWSAYKLD